MQTEAEKAGWEFSKKEGVSLVCINPTFVLGPVVGKRADATSILDFKVRARTSHQCCAVQSASSACLLRYQLC